LTNSAPLRFIQQKVESSEREETMKTMSRSLTAALALAALSCGSAGSSRAQETVTIGTPGIPPVFIAVQVFVAQDQKFFEKYGVKVNIRQFDTGANAARAAIAGDIDLAMSPTAQVINLISNANADAVAVYGYEKPDWLLGSMTPGKKCEDVKGQPVGVDAEGAARSIALGQLVRGCGLTPKDTQQVGMSSNVGAAMASGQLNWGVLHIDDVPIIEEKSGKKVFTVVDINNVAPVTHYLTMVTTRAKAEMKRDGIVRTLAALIDATKFINDPKNAAAAAKAAAPTGRSVPEAKDSIEKYIKIEFWPTKGAGLTQKNIEAMIETQKRVGGIRADATPVTYERFANTSLYEDAIKLVNAKTN
jgi:NitT/TauT family transport system substrate-binding protein